MALDKQPGVCPVGIGRLLAKLVIRATGEEVKTACSSLQLCAGLEASIEGLVYAVAQRRAERWAMGPTGTGQDSREEADPDMPEQDGGEEVNPDMPGLFLCSQDTNNKEEEDEEEAPAAGMDRGDTQEEG
eukprot:7740257-Ditylum_brightwellii.AAC.1